MNLSGRNPETESKMNVRTAFAFYLELVREGETREFARVVALDYLNFKRREAAAQKLDTLNRGGQI